MLKTLKKAPEKAMRFFTEKRLTQVAIFAVIFALGWYSAEATRHQAKISRDAAAVIDAVQQAIPDK